MKPNSFALLKRLDAPVRFLSFSMNDLIAYLAPFFLGALFDSIFIVPFFGTAAIYLLKKVTKKFPKFYAIRYLYWSLPTKSFNRILRVNFPSSNKRLLVK
jgi:type IV conjugative transfer system protein TraL